MRGRTIAVTVALLASPARATPPAGPDRATITKVEVLAAQAEQAVDAGDYEAAVE